MGVVNGRKEERKKEKESLWQRIVTDTITHVLLRLENIIRLLSGMKPEIAVISPW